MHPIPAVIDTGAPRPMPIEPAQSAGHRRVELQRLRRAVGDFEALLLSQMLKSMQRTIPRTGMGQDSGGDVLREVGWEKVAESLGRQGGLGLGDLLFDALKDRVVSDSTASEPDRSSSGHAVALPDRRDDLKDPGGSPSEWLPCEGSGSGFLPVDLGAPVSDKERDRP